MLDNLMGILMSIKVTDVIDIVIVSYLLYELLGFIKETRAQQLFRGVLLIVAFFLVSEVFNLSLLNWLFTRLITVGLIAVVILFQPEIRRGLEQIGRRGVLSWQFRDIVERETMLTDICESGVIVDAEISVRLLGNLFYEGSPLHDGAVIIRGDRVHAASCVLPLTERQNIGKNLGTRHRAALGLSEVSDAFVIVVSEETGAISVAQYGEFKRFLDLKTLEKMLLDIYLPSTEDRDLLSRFRILRGGKRDD